MFNILKSFWKFSPLISLARIWFGEDYTWWRTRKSVILWNAYNNIVTAMYHLKGNNWEYTFRNKDIKFVWQSRKIKGNNTLKNWQKCAVVHTLGKSRTFTQKIRKLFKSFTLRISLVNVTKSSVSCGFGHIYWRSP